MSTDYNDKTVDARLSRLETIIDGISDALLKIERKIDSGSKINWAPVAIGITIFFTVAGSVSTIYNTRISTLNTAVEGLSQRVLDSEKQGVERQLRIETNDGRIIRLERDFERYDERLRDIERQVQNN